MLVAMSCISASRYTYLTKSPDLVGTLCLWPSLSQEKLMETSVVAAQRYVVRRY